MYFARIPDFMNLCVCGGIQKISKRELEEVLDSRTGGVNGRVVLFSFSPFIKSLLDDLSCYSESQIRVIFRYGLLI